MPTPIETNTATIRTILDKVNKLPEGEGGTQSPGFKQVETFEEWSSAASKADNSAFIILKEPSGRCFMMMNDNAGLTVCGGLIIDELNTLPFVDALLESNEIDFDAHKPWIFEAGCGYNYVNVVLGTLDGSVGYILLEFEIDGPSDGPNTELGITAEYYIKA